MNFEQKSKNKNEFTKLMRKEFKNSQNNDDIEKFNTNNFIQFTHQTNISSELNYNPFKVSFAKIDPDIKEGIILKKKKQIVLEVLANSIDRINVITKRINEAKDKSLSSNFQIKSLNNSQDNLIFYQSKLRIDSYDKHLKSIKNTINSIKSILQKNEFNESVDFIIKSANSNKEGKLNQVISKNTKICFTEIEEFKQNDNYDSCNFPEIDLENENEKINLPKSNKVLLKGRKPSEISFFADDKTEYQYDIQTNNFKNESRMMYDYDNEYYFKGQIKDISEISKLSQNSIMKRRPLQTEAEFIEVIEKNLLKEKPSKILN